MKKPVGQKAEQISYIRLQLVLKESRESLYWLKLAERAELVPRSDLQPLLNRADELTKIIAKSVITAKSRGK